jgi:hypothetical protein
MPGTMAPTVFFSSTVTRVTELSSGDGAPDAGSESVMSAPSIIILRRDRLNKLK